MAVTWKRVQQDRQSAYNVTMRRVHETIVAAKNNKHCVFHCVFVRVCARALVSPCVCVGTQAHECVHVRV